MPQLPNISNDVRASALRSNAQGPNTRANSDNFGGQTGEALQRLASGIESFAGGIDAYTERKKNEDAANLVAQSSHMERELAIRNETPPDGKDYARNVRQDFLNYVDEEANKIPDDRTRREYKQRMYSQLPDLEKRSATYQFTLAAENSKAQAEASISTLNNKIAIDPTQYDNYIKQGEDVIDARPGITPSLKAGMKQAWRYDAGKARFQGMMERANTVQEIDAIAGELTNTGGSATGPDDRQKDWSKELLPQDYTTLVNQLGTARKAIVTKADTDARAALDTLEARNKDSNVLIPQDELATVQSLVKVSENPITHQKMVRIMRDQQIIKESRQLQPSELRSQINKTNGNPDIAYPGMPQDVSQSINAATKKFKVSGAYLGGMVEREYGQFLPKGRKNADSKFNPQPQHKGVNLANVRSDVLDAATTAGELFGQPLTINSGYRSQEKQDAIRRRGNPNRASVAKQSHHTSATALDISTVGMSNDDKAKLAGSLVDAGFTGIGEYDTHIHADFRDAVPTSFRTDDKGNTWGGWTYLSPGVAQALKERGFDKGVQSAQIKRAAAQVENLDAVDYSKGTQITKDDGRPASSAVGVAQFTEGTFLEVMKTPGVARRIGVDLTGMSDDQILELRKNPDISIQAAAALGEQNGNALRSALGRDVSDAELDLAHFLGRGGATVLIKSAQSNPNTSAAALLPDAARSNKNVFYKNGKAVTVGELYNSFTRRYATNPSHVTYGDNDTRQRVLTNMEKQLGDDPVTYANSSGTFTTTSLDGPDGFKRRGQDARSIADYYSIPQEDFKPLTQDEANSIKKTFVEGSVDDALQIMSAMQEMGGDMAKAAMKQIGEKDSVYAYAAGLSLEEGQQSVASDIVRGQKRIQENPAIKSEIGATPEDLSAAFKEVAGNALYEAAPRQRQAIMEAATAHYVETAVARGTATAFDKDLFKASVNKVLADRLDTVNGEATVLPKGITGDDMENALQKMTGDDWIELSEQKLPPRYISGDVISAPDLADEARLKSIGGDKYKIMLDDGSYAITGRASQNGRIEAFIFTPTAEDIKSVASRADSSIINGMPVTQDGTSLNNDGVLSPEEEKRIRQDRGALYNFDEDGRWIGPTGGQ